jgi:hypothetical protein
MQPRLNEFVASFRLDAHLHELVVEVLGALPSHVLEDLVGDSQFLLADYEVIPGMGYQVPVRAPSRSPARSVVLKRTLKQRPRDFACYVIAHELAHAHLRNAGRWPGEDPERAADALAAQWGFPRP